jgi:catechol 2,3-dioxygenase-like lactoylglutathione lyase family enzyme
MFNHVMVGTNDIDRAQRFYDAVLGTLGPVKPVRHMAPQGHTRLFYRHDGNTFSVSEPLDGARATPSNGATIGFKCHSCEQVDAFHAAALAHGGAAIEEPPGPRDNGFGPMHIAYVRDPDGNKLCALFRIK